MSLRNLLLLASLPLVGALAPAQNGFEPLDPQYRNVRGVNFIPTYPTLDGTQAFPYFGVASHTALWSFFDDTTVSSVKQQLRIAKRAGFNTVRVFLSYLCWQYHDENPTAGSRNQFASNWDRFLGLCEEEHIRVLPVLWDFVSLAVPYVEPDYTSPDRLHAAANISFWHDSPGRARASAAYGKNFGNLDLGRFVVDCVRTAATHDPNVLLAWDVANEPYVGNDNLGVRSRWFVEQTMALIKRTHGTDKVLVSSGVNDRFPITVAWANDPNCDLIGIHVYGPNSKDLLQAFLYDATYVNGATQPLGKPVLATEIGNPGAGFSYQDTVVYCRDVARPDLGGSATGVGFCSWMLMIGHTDKRPGIDIDDQHPFKHGTGLFYGHPWNNTLMVRDLGAVHAFVDLAIQQGVDRRSLWFGGSPELDAIAAMPPSHPNFVSPLPAGQISYGLAQRWVQVFVLGATRADFELPGWTWDDFRELAALLREMVHPNLDLKHVVSLGNHNPFRSSGASCYDITAEDLDKLASFAAASAPGSAAFVTLIQRLEAQNGLRAGELRPWDPGNPLQARDLRILFGQFLYPFAKTLAPIMLPR